MNKLRFFIYLLGKAQGLILSVVGSGEKVLSVQVLCPLMNKPRFYIYRLRKAQGLILSVVGSGEKVLSVKAIEQF